MLEYGRLLDRQLPRLRTTQNSGDVICGTTPEISKVRAVADETAVACHACPFAHGRQASLSKASRDSRTASRKKSGAEMMTNASERAVRIPANAATIVRRLIGATLFRHDEHLFDGPAGT